MKKIQHKCSKCENLDCDAGYLTDYWWVKKKSVRFFAWGYPLVGKDNASKYIAYKCSKCGNIDLVVEPKE